MRQIILLISTLVVSVVFSGCALKSDVVRSTKIIDYNNEIRYILSKDKKNITLEDQATLAIISENAFKEAKKTDVSESDRISFLSIAARIDWKSNEIFNSYELNASRVFNISDDGIRLCKEMEKNGNAPDRDCFVLKTVIPSIGIEKTSKQLVTSMENIDFSKYDNAKQNLEIVKKNLELMKKHYDDLSTYITDNTIKSHKQLRKYYCTNLTNSLEDGYKVLVRKYYRKIRTYDESFPEYENKELVNDGIEKMEEIQKMKKPKLCGASD